MYVFVPLLLDVCACSIHACIHVCDQGQVPWHPPTWTSSSKLCFKSGHDLVPSCGTNSHQRRKEAVTGADTEKGLTEISRTYVARKRWWFFVLFWHPLFHLAEQQNPVSSEAACKGQRGYIYTPSTVRVDALITLLLRPR